ncbi:MAG: hypothetical protein ACE15B_03245 [Bryobacteraceae bacterium]
MPLFAPPEPRPATRRLPVLAAAAAVFAGSVWLMLYFIPQPHTQADYLVTGTLGTLLGLAIVFLALLRGRL